MPEGEERVDVKQKIERETGQKKWAKMAKKKKRTFN